LRRSGSRSAWRAWRESRGVLGLDQVCVSHSRARGRGVRGSVHPGRQAGGDRGRGGSLASTRRGGRGWVGGGGSGTHRGSWERLISAAAKRETRNVVSSLAIGLLSSGRVGGASLVERDDGCMDAVYQWKVMGVITLRTRERRGLHGGGHRRSSGRGLSGGEGRHTTRAGADGGGHGSRVGEGDER